MSTLTSRRSVARRAAALITTCLVMFAAACTGNLSSGLVVGSGEVTSEAREVSGFTEVAAHGGIRLELVTGSPTAVVVTAQPNLLSITTTKVDGSRLTVDTTRGYTTTRGITVAITAPRLTAITLTGGTAASGDGFAAGSLALELSGGTRLDLKGTVDNLVLEASGGSILELEGLKVTTAKVDLSGGVVATLAVSTSLSGTASGGVVVNLASRPSTLDVETSGGAVVVGP